MAKRNTVVKTRTGYFSSLKWNNVLMAAGLAIVAPYVIRRLMPLFERGLENVTAGEIGVAGRDAGRDVADDLNVGGVSGKIDRGIDRVTDHLSH